jgi:hypothetical protein
MVICMSCRIPVLSGTLHLSYWTLTRLPLSLTIYCYPHSNGRILAPPIFKSLRLSSDLTVKNYSTLGLGYRPDFSTISGTISSHSMAMT